jgi:hemoglobin
VVVCGKKQRQCLPEELVRVNHFFAHTDMEKQRRHQTAFSYAVGGSNQYTGRSMEKAHAGLNLQPEHFDAIAKLLSRQAPG